MNNTIVHNEKGIAIILALIMLLIMSVMALTISFMSNIDFNSMANYKRGQEAFLAAETCVRTGRHRFETVGIENLYFQLQGFSDPSLVPSDSSLVLLEPLYHSDNQSSDPDDWDGPMCRSGPRIFDSTSQGHAKLIEIPPPSKVTGRPIKNISLQSGGQGGAALVPVTFTVTGKDSEDEDKADTNSKINTGTEIGVGFETFIPGGSSNVY